MSMDERLTAVQDQTPKVMGFLCWYSCTETYVTRDQLEHAVRAAGLDEKYLPHPISYRDAFRRATSVRWDGQLPVAAGQYLNLIVRPVKTTGEEIVRNLVREIRDENHRRLDHRSVAQLTLRTDETIDIARYAPTFPQEEEVLANIVSAYQRNRSHYSGQVIRTVVKAVLDDCQPVAVRPTGGVYFVHAKYEAAITALKTFLNDHISKLSQTERTRLYRVPVIDSAEQRDTIQESLEDQVRREAQSFMETVSEILREGRTVTHEAFENFLGQARRARELVLSYEELLEREVVTAKTFLNLMEQQAMSLAEHVREDESSRTAKLSEVSY